jgi:hypothetical protein
MPSVLRYPHPPGLPKKSGTSLSVVPSSPKSLPRPVVVDAYKAATPSHTTLQHQPHTLDNHLKITSSKVRTITTPSAYHRLERAQGANVVAVLRPQSKHRTRAILGLTRPNQTTNLTDTIQSYSHRSLTTVHKTVLNIITRCFASRLHLHGTFSRHHLIVDAHDLHLHLHLHHIHHILLLTHLAAFVWTVISCYSNHWSRDWPQRRLQRLFPSHQLPSFYTPLSHHNTTP